MGSSGTDSCCGLFTNSEVLPLQSQYIFFLLLFVVKNKVFRSDSDVHDINTRHNYDLHLPIPNLTVFQKGVFNI
jgi:hypothetical protein